MSIAKTHDKPGVEKQPEGTVVVRCSTDFGIRKCDKFLGFTYVCFEYKYCKSCRRTNYYEVLTEKGLQKLKDS